jgi:C_GCAxxG_C_C family probable redox protein
MGRMGATCGAVTGAFMAIGLKYGKAKAKDDAARDKTYELVREFVNRFQARHGSIICKELLGYDLSNPQEGEAAKEKGLFDTRCPQFVRDATEMLEEIL